MEWGGGDVLCWQACYVMGEQNFVGGSVLC